MGTQTTDWVEQRDKLHTNTQNLLKLLYGRIKSLEDTVKSLSETSTKKEDMDKVLKTIFDEIKSIKTIIEESKEVKLKDGQLSAYYDINELLNSIHDFIKNHEDNEKQKDIFYRSKLNEAIDALKEELDNKYDPTKRAKEFTEKAGIWINFFKTIVYIIVTISTVSVVVKYIILNHK